MSTKSRKTKEPDRLPGYGEDVSASPEEIRRVLDAIKVRTTSTQSWKSADAEKELSRLRSTDRKANFDHWNKFPVLTIRQAICLTIGIEPSTPRELKHQMRYEEIGALAIAHHSHGTLKLQLAREVMVSTADWQDWLVLVSVVRPKSWKASVFEIDKKGIDAKRREEGVRAAIAMLSERVPRCQQDVINFMSDRPQDYPACLSRTVSDETLTSSFRSAGGSILKDARYLKAAKSRRTPDTA